MLFNRWNVAGLLAHDTHVWGARSKEGIDRIKKSDDHVFAPSHGWMSTELVGGRAKLQRRKGIRKWKVYRVCFCEGGQHDPIPQDWDQHLDHLGNPKNITWTTECPLNMFKAVQDMLPGADCRTYPKWNPNTAAFGKECYGKKTTKAEIQMWLNVQGANPDGLTFDSNGGRKSLGNWLGFLQLAYALGFELHGDMWKTWKQYYQFNLAPSPRERSREQSKDPDDCCRALREFARRLLGRGQTVQADPVDLTLSQDLQILDLRTRGHGVAVNAILEKHRLRALQNEGN